MSTESKKEDTSDFEEKLLKTEHRSHLGTEAAAVASGVAAGALVGTVAGPPGALAGAVVGGVIGAVAGLILDREEQQRDAKHIEHDREMAEADEAISRRASQLPPPPKPGPREPEEPAPREPEEPAP